MTKILLIKSVLFHNFDFITDIWYFWSVPIYSLWITIPLVISICLPVVVTGNKAYKFAKEENKGYKWALKHWLINFTGTEYLYGFFFNDEDFCFEEPTSEEDKK